MLMRNGAAFDLAVRLREGRATLGEAFSFMSGLYFRGKLAYCEAFADPPPGTPGAFIITSSCGLMPPETPVGVQDLLRMSTVAIDEANPDYRVPLERTCMALLESAGAECEFVLLGSVATAKYVEPIAGVFGDRLLFPEEFAGRGDMSRGGLMLRCAESRTLLTHVPLGTAQRHGPRPPKLPTKR